jgi:hypothetical protein
VQVVGRSFDLHSIADATQSVVSRVGNIVPHRGVFPFLYEKENTMLNNSRYVKAMIFQMAQDDPDEVISKITELRSNGEIGADDLGYVEAIAESWRNVTQNNLMRAERAANTATTQPRSSDFGLVQTASQAVVGSLFPTKVAFGR